MPEYRQDPLTGRTVIVAEERAARPHQFDIEETDDANDGDRRRHCPFCEGNEAMTPGELAAFRRPGTAPDTPGWTARAVPNKFPAVARNDAAFPDCRTFQESFAKISPWGMAGLPSDVADRTPVPGVGNHEVLVDTPRHVLSVSDLGDGEVVDMFRMYRSRLRSLQAEGRWACVQIFKNVGAAAGASLPHSHSQLIAMPFVPASLLSILHRARDYREKSNGSACFWCDMLGVETGLRQRIVEETANFVVLCPYVSRFTAEVEIYPKSHQGGFEDIDEASRLPEFAALVRRTVVRLERAVSWMKGRLGYNFVLQTRPFLCPDGAADVFHWHLSILPSLARAAGFEWGTGLHINPIPPELAAQKLRDSEL